MEDVNNILNNREVPEMFPHTFTTVFKSCSHHIQIKDEGFVEDINNILNSGEVPNMFPSDEKMTVGAPSGDRGVSALLLRWLHNQGAAQSNGCFK